MEKKINFKHKIEQTLLHLNYQLDLYLLINYININLYLLITSYICLYIIIYNE